ncbi:hypothetical protein [Negadavirga shengliensis]|uniref:Outer membrane protein beta-barrel domain-containing protein n=1 Tax=Negadavirga shengliensis TaxID=1389218 RepID=A0ABV9T8L6_9BACT
MKKYLIAIILMAIVQLAFGKPQVEPDRPLNDSIIVEFGKSGKVVFVIDNPEDFERLKSMDINQIIRELDLPEQEKNGEVTVVEIRQKDGVKEIIRVYEGGNETEVAIGRYRLIVDESGQKTQVKVETSPKEKKDPPFRTYFNADLGINTFFEDGSIPGGGAPYAAKGWGSWNVGVNWMASQRLSKGAYWDFGLGVSWYNFKLDNPNNHAVGSEDGISFINRTDVNGMKSKISASYLNALTMFKLDFGKINDSGRNGLRVGIGPYAGYRLGGRSKFVYREPGGSGRKKEKDPAGSYLNNFRYGLRGEVGFRSITFFTTYDFNPLFHKDLEPTLNPFSFGVVF